MSINTVHPPDLGTPSYVQGLRGHPEAWRSVVAVVAGLTAFAAVVFGAAIPLGIALDRLLGVTPFDPLHPSFTIGFWVGGNLLLAMMIPICMLVQRVVHGVPYGSLSSVAGHFRWRLLLRIAVVVLPVWAVVTVVLQLFRPAGDSVFTRQHIILVAVAVITVPLQSAGEEFLFRGLLFRAIGAPFRRPLVSLGVAGVATSVAFALFHGADNGWTLAYYLVSGVAFGLMTQFSGGLEASSLVHAANNTFLLIPTILAGQLSSLSAVTGPILLLPMIVMAAMTVIVRRRAGHHGSVAALGD
ncbi:lysostaphin resistance A-like protein [Streptomyces sp. NPDC087851]|uniref:CPBP family intramembrane glutamic endopeptidase n=1 Tax=Streptomyces sp. NPDC087851 TaxID=3365810 RepID=UPI0037F33F34